MAAQRGSRIDSCVADLEAIVSSELTEREKRNKLRSRMRRITGRTPRWVSEAARRSSSGGEVTEHVVPLRILAGHLIAGADPRGMLAVADITCRITRDEDQQVSHIGYRWPDLEAKLTSPPSKPSRLAGLGWDRYRRAGVSVVLVGHRRNGLSLLANEPCPCGSRRRASNCCHPAVNA